ncbi:MAG: RHS repeat-associated core domain-containing protein, partial [Planctomycetes bacterium]|nr:RHS repeat-associated core domain-containing protein [Planctomycetota bacterium]
MRKQFFLQPGNRTKYGYDAANRQIQRKYPDGSRVTQVYDVIGNRTLLRDATGRYTATFDALDRLSVRTNPANKRITYTYDGISQRRRLADPDGGLFTTVYDAARRITKIINPQAVRTTFGYDTANRRTVKVLGNSSRTTFTYDNADRLTRLVNIKSSGVTISSFGYRYDKTTRRTGVTEASGDRVTWTYDPTYQLVNEKRSGVNSYNVTYTYDPAGNRTVKMESGARTTSTYDAANRLKTAQDGTGRTTFTFDAAGNQTKQVSPSGTITTSVWNFENMNTATRLSSSSIVTLVYNGDQMRVEKDSSSSTRKLIYDGQNILQETDGSNLTQAAYTLEPQEFGNLVSQRQNQSGTWVQVYYAFDGLGSTDSLTNGSQVITDTYTYFAFGVIKASTGTTTNLFTWVGQLGYVRDTETGEYQLHVRQLLPDRGRFKSQDPLGVQPDANLARYVGNSPVTETDPSGQSPAEDTVAKIKRQLGLSDEVADALQEQLVAFDNLT